MRSGWVVASAGQVYSCRVAAEVRRLMRSNIHRCIRAMSTVQEGRSRTGRHERLKMVPNTDEAAAGAGVFRVALRSAGKCSSSPHR